MFYARGKGTISYYRNTLGSSCIGYQTQKKALKKEYIAEVLSKRANSGYTYTIYLTERAFSIQEAETKLRKRIKNSNYYDSLLSIQENIHTPLEKITFSNNKGE